MEVKCPKCRLKFEEDTQAGITEKACVCPRCGTPFIFKIESEENAPEVKNTTSGAPTTPQHKVSSTVASQQNKASEQAEEATDSVSYTNKIEPTFSSSTPSYKRHTAPQRRMRGSDIGKWILIIALMAFVGVVTFNYLNKQDISYSADNEQIPTQSDVSSTEDSSHDLIDKKDRWMEGSWRTENENIHFTYTIRGNRISITEEDGTSITGKYTLDSKYLYFGDYKFLLDKDLNCMWYYRIKFEHYDLP